MLEPIFYQIVSNELEKRLNRKPTETECQNAYKDVIDNFGCTDCMADIGDTLTDYIKNNYTQCEQCGKYFLNDDIQEIKGTYGWELVCSNTDCEMNAYEDVNYRRRYEWATIF